MIGTSGQSAGVYLWPGPGQVKYLGPSLDNFSAYAVCLSPDGQRVAIGTKRRAGDDGNWHGCVEVWSVADPTVATLLAQYRFTHPVPALDWLDDHTLAVGTQDGGSGRGLCQLLRWSPGAGLNLLPPAAGNVIRHAGAVWAVKSLGQGSLLSVGQEGLVRITNWQTGAIEAEFSGDSVPPPGAISPAVVTLPGGEEVMVQFPNGRVKLLRREETWRAETIPVLSGAAGGFATLGETILLADWGSSKARIYRREGWTLQREVNLGRPFRSVQALSPTMIALLHHVDASVSIWELEPELRCVENLTVQAVRSLGGGPSPALLAAQAQDDRARTHAQRLGQLQEAMAQANDFEDVRRRMAAISADGLGFEALVMLADWCRSHKNDAAEIFVRAELCRSLPENEPASALHWRIYGDLLATHGESEFALAALRRAQACDPAMIDLEPVIAELEAHPSPAAGEDAVWVVPAESRAIGPACEVVRQAILRDFALGRPVPRRYGVEFKTGEELGQGRPGEGALDFPKLAAHFGSLVAGKIEVAECNFMAVSGGQRISARCLCLNPELAGAAQTVALSVFADISQSAGTWEYRLIVAHRPPAAAVTASEPGPALQDWLRIERLMEHDQSLLGKRCEQFEKALRLVAGKMLLPGGSTSGGTESAPAQGVDTDSRRSDTKGAEVEFL